MSTYIYTHPITLVQEAVNLHGYFSLLHNDQQLLPYHYIIVKLL